jgi:hypothetical protein
MPPDKASETPVFDAMIEEARRTSPAQWIDHEELGRRLAFTAEERAAARARIERRLREDEQDTQGGSSGVRDAVDETDARCTLRVLVSATAGTRAVALLTFSMYRDLVEQTGSDQAAQQFLEELASDVGCPVGVSIPTKGGPHTVFVPPRGWTEKWLREFVGDSLDAARAAFGPIRGRPWSLHGLSGPATSRSTPHAVNR